MRTAEPWRSHIGTQRGRALAPARSQDRRPAAHPVGHLGPRQYRRGGGAVARPRQPSAPLDRARLAVRDRVLDQLCGGPRAPRPRDGRSHPDYR